MFQVSPADSGFYSCVAGNILGESVSSAHLAISPAPGLRCLPLVVMASLCLVLASHSLSDPAAVSPVASPRQIFITIFCDHQVNIPIIIPEVTNAY